MIMKKVAVIMGSDSDFPVMKNAVKSLKDMGIPVEAHVLSAHRTPAEAGAFASSARQNGFGVIIAAAGKAAHLAGVLAGHTTLPVIGVPMKASVLDGMDALLATVQMPSGQCGAFGCADPGGFRAGAGGQAGSPETGNGAAGAGKRQKAAGGSGGALKKRTKRMMKMPKGDYCNMEEITYEKAGTVV